MLDYVIKEQIAEISSNRHVAKRLSVISWGRNREKLDLRVWIADEPGRGITLTDDEAEILVDALNSYLQNRGFH